MEIKTSLPKRQLRQPHKETDKRLRITATSTGSSQCIERNELAGDSDDALCEDKKLTSDNAEMMARHVVGHLQVLMLITIRLAALQDEEHDGKDDTNSDSVDFGDSHGDPESQTHEEKPSIGGAEYIEMTGGEELPEDPEMVLELDGSPIPDVDIDFSDLGVRTHYDDLSMENDKFLQEMIKSGAYQSHSQDNNWDWNGSDEPVLRIVTPPEMNRPPKKPGPYDLPNADVRIDNVIQACDMERYRPSSSLDDSCILVFKSQDPDCERERPMINLVIPTPRVSPVVVATEMSDKVFEERADYDAIALYERLREEQSVLRQKHRQLDATAEMIMVEDGFHEVGVDITTNSSVILDPSIAMDSSTGPSFPSP